MANEDIGDSPPNVVVGAGELCLIAVADIVSGVTASRQWCRIAWHGSGGYCKGHAIWAHGVTEDIGFIYHF